MSVPNHYTAQLNKKTINYLSGRGLTLSTIKYFKIGTALSFNEEMQNLEVNKTADVTDKRAEGKGVYPLFSEGVVFPVITIAGKVKGFSRREFVKSNYGKYINSRYLQKDTFMYGEHTIRGAKRVGIMEGQIDVSLAYQELNLPSVAPLGSAVNIKHIRRLKWLGVKQIVAFGDNDKAGRKFNYLVMSYCEEVGIPCVIGKLDSKYSDLGDLGADLSWDDVTLVNPYEWIIDLFNNIKSPVVREKFWAEKISLLSFKGANLKAGVALKKFGTEEQFKSFSSMYQVILSVYFDFLTYEEMIKELGYYRFMLESYYQEAIQKRETLPIGLSVIGCIDQADVLMFASDGLPILSKTIFPYLPKYEMEHDEELLALYGDDNQD